MIEAAIEGGIRFFDTAQQYQNGGSEAKYGRFLSPNRSSTVSGILF
jgi:aryl-alcohol dehydrogenase-like predicted oxidoreductase